MCPILGGDGGWGNGNYALQPGIGFVHSWFSQYHSVSLLPRINKKKRFSCLSTNFLINQNRRGVGFVLASVARLLFASVE